MKIIKNIFLALAIMPSSVMACDFGSLVPELIGVNPVSGAKKYAPAKASEITCGDVKVTFNGERFILRASELIGNDAWLLSTSIVAYKKVSGYSYNYGGNATIELRTLKSPGATEPPERPECDYKFYVNKQAMLKPLYAIGSVEAQSKERGTYTFPDEWIYSEDIGVAAENCSREYIMVPASTKALMRKINAVANEIKVFIDNNPELWAHK